MYKKTNILLSSIIAPIPLLGVFALIEILKIPRELPDLSKESLSQLHTITPFLLPLYIAYLIFLLPIVYYICINLIKYNILKFKHLIFLSILISSFIIGIYFLSLKNFTNILTEQFQTILFVYIINFAFAASLFISLKIMDKNQFLCKVKSLIRNHSRPKDRLFCT